MQRDPASATVPVPAGMHADEWAARQQLAACYRIFAMLGWTEMIYNHITLRLPASVSGAEKHFLINPFGLHYTEVTASNLVKSLTDQGLLQVRKEGPDRRAVQLHLLPPGHEILQRAPGPFAGVLPQALASLDAVTLARLEQDLGQLIGRLGADDRGAGIPLAQM